MSNKSIIIIGTGGHAKVLLEALELLGGKILGFVTSDKGKLGHHYLGYELLGNDNVLSRFSTDDVVLVNGIGSLPSNNTRWEVAKRMREKGFSFISIIHPSAIVSKNVLLLDGVQIMAGAIVQAGVTIGRDSIINTGVCLDHDCNIGNNCHLSPRVTCCGSVHIEDGVYVGASTSVIQNIIIGEYSTIAAGSVVYSNLAAKTTFIQKK